MLNRTNRTLSAHSDRLNLGTRSLALTASVLNVANSLRSVHTHPHSFMRMESMRGVGKPAQAIPDAITGYRRDWFLSRSTGATDQVCSVRRWVDVVAEQPPVEQEVIPTFPSWPTGRASSSSQPRLRATLPARAAAARAAGQG